MEDAYPKSLQNLTKLKLLTKLPSLLYFYSVFRINNAVFSDETHTKPIIIAICYTIEPPYAGVDVLVILTYRAWERHILEINKKGEKK